MSDNMTKKTHTKVFEPKVLVFACNWCSYAGADNAGVSRIPYSPNVRLLRTMCSGRVHPSFVLDAFAKGADGVLVSGCHFGDCHYMFGNYKAEEQYEKLTKLVNLLGIDPGRIGLEWISAAEGPRFAEVINGFVDTIRELGPSPLAKTNGEKAAETDFDLRNYHLYECLECGRCTGVCPVARTNKFSPRRLLSRAISSGLKEIALDSSVWECLTCRLCENVCPSDIPYSELNKKVRSVSQELNVENTCTHGGVFEQISTIMARPGLKQNRLGWITKDLKVKKRDSDTLFFTGCAPYFSAYFGDQYSDTLEGSLQSAVKLMNKVGIEPLVLPNELCCGHDLLLRGESSLFESLKVKVADQIKKTKVKRIVFTCPECLVTIKEEYSDQFKGTNIEYVHLSELMKSELKNLKFYEEEFSTTYQDPCRLGRYSNIYDQPREILGSIPGVKINELPHNRERTICCGNTAWIGCNSGTKELQKGKLQEILDTGSDNLLTACPKCFIHLKCAQNGTEDSPYKSININDIWNFVGSHLQ